MKTKDFVTYLITSLVSHPEDVSLSEEKDGDILRFWLRVNSDDMKYIIGRGGKTIRALQSALRVHGIKIQHRVYLNLLED